jgi:hypothetical protein
MAAEYPLDFKPAAAAVSPGGGLVNPKSKPLVLPDAPAQAQAKAAFPTTPDALRPTGDAAAALPSGALPSVSGGARVTNAAVYALIQQHFPAAQWDNANRVSKCESGQRNVVSQANFNGTRDYGVFQINTVTLPGLLTGFGYPRTALEMGLDADFNVRAASKLWQQRGWQPWVCASRLGIVDGLWSSAPGPGDTSGR